jgi:hypothetical protein
MSDVVLRTGKEIVDAKDLMTTVQQPLTQVRAEKSDTAGDENAFSCTVSAHLSSPIMQAVRLMSYDAVMLL